jgi:hypothetical protein
VSSTTSVESGKIAGAQLGITILENKTPVDPRVGGRVDSHSTPERPTADVKSALAGTNPYEEIR